MQDRVRILSVDTYELQVPLLKSLLEILESCLLCICPVVGKGMRVSRNLLSSPNPGSQVITCASSVPLGSMAIIRIQAATFSPEDKRLDIAINC